MIARVYYAYMAKAFTVTTRKQTQTVLQDQILYLCKVPISNPTFQIFQVLVVNTLLTVRFRSWGLDPNGGWINHCWVEFKISLRAGAHLQ